jgi:hypothetical protein
MSSRELEGFKVAKDERQFVCRSDAGLLSEL